MKDLYKLFLVLALSLLCASVIVLPAYAQEEPTPPMNPETTWQPPYEGGQFMEPSVNVETYNHSWPSLGVIPPSSVAPGIPSSMVSAYLVNSYGQIVNNLYRNELCYLIVSFNGPGYFYLWEYYPSGTDQTYGHWLCYKWYRPSAGVWKIGPFAAESWEPSGQYTWRMWFLSGFSWTTRTLSFNYTRGYYPFDIPTTIPSPVYAPAINSFNSNLSSIDAGQTATLTWTTSNATSVTISPGVGTVASSGSTTVTPVSTTIYTLTASGNTGSPATSNVTVTVVPRVAPTISIDRSTIQAGETATLSWSAPGAKQVTISQIGSAGTKGSIPVTPHETATYTLNALYVDGTGQTASITVNVTQPPYLLWGLIGLLAIAAILITVLLLTRPRKAPAVQHAATQPARTTMAAATTPSAETTPSTTSVIEAIPAKLATPDGSEIILAGNNRSFGRHDFEKFMAADKVSYISRQHINIWYEDKQYFIEDRSSTNGTRVNGTEIKGSGRRALEDGDTIDLGGKLTITFKK
jgi:hypothetical protein